jgi:glycosyltransferase involved in cell wall biosynthesis
MAAKVSVITAVFNGEKSLARSVESVLSQSMSDFEFIIVNDASTDSSADILAGFDDPRILVIENEKNLGLSASLNRALAVAKGEFVARHDADDLSLPERFEQQVAYLDAHPQVGVLGSQMETVDEHGKNLGKYALPISQGMIAWNLLFDRSFAHPSVMMRRELLLNAGGYDEDYKVSQDIELWSRLVFETGFANLPEVLVRYQSSSVSVSQRKSVQQYSNRMQARQQLASQLLGEEVSLKTVKWLDSAQKGDAVFEINRQKMLIEFLHDVYSEMIERGIIPEEDSGEVYADLLERIVRVGQAGESAISKTSSAQIVDKLRWAASNPLKAGRKVFGAGKADALSADAMPENKQSATVQTRINQLSVVVLTHEREAGLTSLLKSLLMQKMAGQKYELILINNSPDSFFSQSANDKLGKLIAQFEDCKVVNNSHNWRTPIRYAMATLASSERVLFLDDDLRLLDEYFLSDMLSSFRELEPTDILSCWNELWLEWGEKHLRSVALDFLTPGIEEMILSDTIGPGIAMFKRSLLLEPTIMDMAMQKNQEQPIVSDMGFPLTASMTSKSHKYYFPAYGRLAFHEEAHKGAIYQIPKRHSDLLNLYKGLKKSGYIPVMDQLDDLPENQAERVKWAAETLPSKEYPW